MIKLRQILTESPELSSAADITEKELKTAKIVVNGLVKRGFSRIGAVGLAGNISVESRFKTAATDGRAEGLCQWQGKRLTALKAFAKSKGSSYTSLSLQLDFMKYELLDSFFLKCWYTNLAYKLCVPLTGQKDLEEAIQTELNTICIPEAKLANVTEGSQMVPIGADLNEIQSINTYKNFGKV